MNNNYGSQLPYNPTQPEVPYLTITPQSLPWVPVYSGEPFMQSYIASIAMNAANEIQQRSGVNPLRMFMYNQMVRPQLAQQHFANQDFERLVIDIADYIRLLILQRQATTPDQALAAAVTMLVELACAKNLQLYPALEQYLDPQTINNVRAGIMQYDQLIAQLNHMRNQQRATYSSQMQAPMQQNPMMHPGPRSPMGSYPQANVNTAYRNTHTANTSLFQAQPGAPLAGQLGHGRSMAGSRYENTPQQTMQTPNVHPQLQQPFQAREAPVMQPVNPIQIIESDPRIDDAVTEALAAEGLLVWDPSPKYPYLPVYNPLEKELFLVREADGTIRPDLRPLPKEKMDYHRHGLTTVFGPIPKNYDREKTLDTLKRIEDGAKRMTGEPTMITSGDGGETKITRPFVEEGIILETSEAAAWLQGSLSRLAADKGRIPPLYRVYAQIADPVVSLKDQREMIDYFATSRTFVELREKLAAVGDDITEDLKVIIDNKLAAMMNRIVAQNMSIPGKRIDSFVTDLPDLLNAIEDEYGDDILEAMLRHQRTNIRAAFQQFDQENAKSFTQSFIEERKYPDNVIPQVTYLASYYSLTYLDCLAQEMAIELQIGIGAAVTKAISPLMHTILQSLFVDTDSKVYPVERHLLRTNDNRILEAAKGYLGNDFYTLTLLK